MSNFFIINQLQLIWHWDFMRTAYEAGTLVAIVAGAVGYFVVVRRSAFAAHALSHAGFSGAAGAVLLGLHPIVGLLAFTMGGGVLMGVLGKKAEGRDVQVGIVLSFMLGLGLLFISLYKGYATEAYSLLFGQIFGISTADVVIILIAAIILLTSLAVIYRPLLFSSLDEDVAEAKGLPVFAIGIIFMLLIAVATSISVQIVGVLLIFALMVTPAAIAERLAKTPAQGMTISISVALLITWTGLTLAFYTPFPASFCITAVGFVLYMVTRLLTSRTRSTHAHSDTHTHTHAH
jgi:zinc/manganese transport system permease protein